MSHGGGRRASRAAIPAQAPDSGYHRCSSQLLGPPTPPDVNYSSGADDDGKALCVGLSHVSTASLRLGPDPKGSREAAPPSAPSRSASLPPRRVLARLDLKGAGRCAGAQAPPRAGLGGVRAEPRPPGVRTRGRASLAAREEAGIPGPRGSCARGWWGKRWPKRAGRGPGGRAGVKARPAPAALTQFRQKLGGGDGGSAAHPTPERKRPLGPRRKPGPEPQQRGLHPTHLRR